MQLTTPHLKRNVAASLLTLATVGIGLTSPATAVDAVLWNGDVEVGGVPHGTECAGTGAQDGADSAIDQYDRIQEGYNLAAGVCGDVAFVSTPTRSETSLRSMRVHMPAGARREQAIAKHLWTPDDKGSVERWFGLSLYIDPDWDLSQVDTSSERFLSLVSFRTEGANGSMNVSGESDGHMALRRNSTFVWPDGLSYDKIDLGPMTKGKWIDLIFHIKFSTTTTGALREVWRDGVLMGSKTSRNTVDTLQHYFRVGVYQGPGVTDDRTTYFDNVKIGASYAAVDPAPQATTTAGTATTATPTFVGATSGTGNGVEANAVTLTAPGGTRGGTLLLGSIALRGSGKVTPPPGWSLVQSTQSPANLSLRTYRYFCPSGGCQGQSWVWKSSLSNGASGVLGAYDGVSSVAPVSTAAAQTNAFSTLSPAPSVDTVDSNERIINIHAITGARTFLADSGTTERAEGIDRDGVYRSSAGLSDAVQVTPGSTGTRRATFSAAGSNIGATLALRH